jgi:hypothetical protein
LLDSDTRMNLLRSHPATVARLFDYKQDCMWKYLVMGESKPFGEVTDFWRRVEVCSEKFLHNVTFRSNTITFSIRLVEHHMFTV